MDWSSGWWWWMLPMMTFMVVLVGAVIWALVTVMRSGTSTTGAERPTADEILHERFARGEIGAAEYRERMDALHGNRATGI
jgi:putative membrane protein